MVAQWGRTVRRITVVAAAVALAPPATAPAAKRPTFSGPTNSSPITISRDGRFVWAVSPGSDRVVVISTRTNAVVRRIKVGDEPQSVALDPANKHAYVANAASGTVTVIQIRRVRARTLTPGRKRTLITGAEPWNIVASPDGRRVFVANSSQDKITVIDADRARPRIIGHIDIRNSRCNDPDRSRHFQPRGLAVTSNSKRLFVTSFFAFTRPGGRQADDNGRQGLVCRLNVNTKSKKIRGYRPAARITLAPQTTGFKIDSTGDGVPENTAAFPNQLQSIVVRGNQAYLPNIAASPDGPLRFNVDTQAFVNVIDNVRSGREVDASAAKFINLHLGARNPEPGKKKIFFANAWAIAFSKIKGADTVYGGSAATAYVVSAGADLLVKVLVRPGGKLVLTQDNDTTRYIDLADPANPVTSGEQAGRTPQGIVINRAGTRAYVVNKVSRNVSVVDLKTDKVMQAIRIAPLPAPIINVGAQMFFSSRGHFDRPAQAGANISTEDRLSSEGWQSCASCHSEGLTDSIIWEFAAGPRKSVPLNSTFNPHDRANDQRVLNYSAIFDEVEDFEANIRNVSGPGALAAPLACSEPPPATSTLTPNHGLLIGDNGDINRAPCVVNAFPKPNAGRPQVTVTLPGSTTAVPALTALREWVRFAVRTPNGPLPTTKVKGGEPTGMVATGRQVFQRAGCASCHGGSNWTSSRKDFTSPPAAPEIFTETTPPPQNANPVGAQYLARFLRNIGSFNKGVPGAGNDIGTNIGATEKAAAAVANGVAQPAQDALGVDFNGDGKGNGYSPPSLLGIFASPPYYHNGACETLACVVTDLKHRTANGTMPDALQSAKDRAAVVAYLRSIDVDTPAP